MKLRHLLLAALIGCGTVTFVVMAMQQAPAPKFSDTDPAIIRAQKDVALAQRDLLATQNQIASLENQYQQFRTKLTAQMTQQQTALEDKKKALLAAAKLDPAKWDINMNDLTPIAKGPPPGLPPGSGGHKPPRRRIRGAWRPSR